MRDRVRRVEGWGVGDQFVISFLRFFFSFLVCKECMTANDGLEFHLLWWTVNYQ